MAKNTNRKAAGIGIGALAATAAGVAAGYYFYASKDAKKNRKIAAKWATQLKDDVVRQAKKAKNLDRAQMMKIVDQAAAAYETVRAVDRRDLARAMNELKSNWQTLAGEMNTGGKRAAKSVRSSASKATKTAKKAISRVKKAKR